MSEEKKHIHYTAEDIEKYNSGRLSSRERNALEKAALDDPFLAEAMEGYAVSDSNLSKDMADLHSRLQRRLDEKKVIPLPTSRGSFYSMMKVAAMIVLIAGAGFFVYRFAFNNKKSKENIAQIPTQKGAASKPADSIRSKIETVKTERSSIKSNPGDLDTRKVSTKPKSSITRLDEFASGSGGNSRRDTAVFYLDNKSEEKSVASAPVNGYIKDNNSGVVIKSPVELKSAAKDDNAARALSKTDKDVKELANEKQETRDAVKFGETYSRDFSRSANRQPDNTFRGKVTDANNNPVPFANVTNTNDNVGTYSDAMGNFNLTSPDTVLNVQIRSIGFTNNNVLLRGNNPTSQVVMQEDRGLNARVIDPVYRNANRAATNSITVEEPEPADGWANYDAYLINNLKAPDDIRNKKIAGAVELSFEVNQDGEPINIKVEKSLCSKCDKEAIRLIKDGPKWKRNAKKGRTTVTIPF